MKMQTILRLFFQGIIGMRSNMVAYFFAICITMLVVFLATLFFVALATVNETLQVSRGEAKFQVYWQNIVPEQKLQAQWKTLRTKEWLQDAVFYTSKEALQELGQKLSQAGANVPVAQQQTLLPPTALLTFVPEVTDPEAWAVATIAELSKLEGVTRVAHSPLQDKLGKAWRSMHVWILWPSIIFLCLIMSLVIGNTVQLTLSTRKDEVSILELVGATSFYVMFPQLISGGFIGFIGGLVGVFAAWLVYVCSSLVPTLAEFGIIATFPQAQQVYSLVLLPIVIGLVSSWFAVYRRSA